MESLESSRYASLMKSSIALEPSYCSSKGPVETLQTGQGNLRNGGVPLFDIILETAPRSMLFQWGMEYLVLASLIVHMQLCNIIYMWHFSLVSSHVG